MKFLRTWLIVVPLYVLSIMLLLPAFAVAVAAQRLQVIADLVDSD